MFQCCACEILNVVVVVVAVAAVVVVVVAVAAAAVVVAVVVVIAAAAAVVVVPLSYSSLFVDVDVDVVVVAMNESNELVPTTMIYRVVGVVVGVGVVASMSDAGLHQDKAIESNSKKLYGCY